MAVEIENGPEKLITVSVAKSLISNPSCVRFAVTTQKPGFKNNGPKNHGSSSIDIFPGQGEFPGRIPGFVQVFTPQDDSTDAMQVIDPITYFFYDGINPITEVDDYGAVTANYVYAGGLHVARVTTDTFWYHCDALGSPRRMTDRSGSAVWNCFYYPFGEQKWPESEQISNSHQFTGKEWDTDMSLNYFCQRYYDPSIGRFMALDPERPAASSPYAYCYNNPLRFIDPLGRKAQVQAQEFLEKLFDEKWTLAQSGISQLAPEIFGEGWWRESYGDNAFGLKVYQAMFWLKSGLWDWDVLTKHGWVEFNPGLAIISMNITLVAGATDGEYAAVTNDRFRIFLNAGDDGIMAISIYDLMCTIEHELTHHLQKESGERRDFGGGHRHTAWQAKGRNELEAYGRTLARYGDLLSPDFRAQNMVAMMIYYVMYHSALWPPARLVPTGEGQPE